MALLNGLEVKREGNLIKWGARRWILEAIPLDLRKKLLAVLEAETTAPTVAPKPTKKRKQTNESESKAGVRGSYSISARGTQKRVARRG